MNRNDGAVGDARKRLDESIARLEERDDHHIATGQDLPARKSYLDLADLIADDTAEPMWSAVVIAKHIIDSDWMARVIAHNRFMGKADAMAQVLDPKGPIWRRMHAEGWDEGWTAGRHWGAGAETGLDTNPYGTEATR